MNRLIYMCGFVLFICFSIEAAASSQPESIKTSDSSVNQGKWMSFVRGGIVYQFDTDIGEGGGFTATRFTMQAGTGYNWDRQTGISLSLGYSCDGYDFAGDNRFGSVRAWDDIHTISFGIPMRLRLDDEWTAFAIPSLRSTGESGAVFNDTVTGGFLGGFSYRISDNLTIGPGFGIFSQLEDSATVIPIIIIDWKISSKWSITTGRGLGATMGPGITLNYKPNRMWRFGIGGRYEKLRFRLDEDGEYSGGVGEDSSFPLFINASCNISPNAQISLVGGFETGGELKLEDKSGKTISEESYDTGVFLGATFNMRL